MHAHTVKKFNYIGNVDESYFSISQAINQTLPQTVKQTSYNSVTILSRQCICARKAHIWCIDADKYESNSLNSIPDDRRVRYRRVLYM